MQDCLAFTSLIFFLKNNCLFHGFKNWTDERLYRLNWELGCELGISHGIGPVKTNISTIKTIGSTKNGTYFWFFDYFGF